MQSNDLTKITTSSECILEIDRLASKQRLKLSDLHASNFSEMFFYVAGLLNNTKNPRQIISSVKKQDFSIPECQCGNNVLWNPDLREYRKYCSTACTARYTVEDKKIKNLQESGYEWHTQSADWAQKVKDTSLQKFGVSHYSKTNSYKSQVKLSNLDNYGVQHVMQLAATKNKIKDTCLKKYGVSNPSQNINVRAKLKETNLAKYGFANPALNVDVIAKTKKTNLERYGVENPASNQQVRERISQTFKNNYYPADVLEKLNDVKWLNDEHVQGKPVHAIANDLNVSSSNLCKHFHKLGINIVHHSASEVERQLVAHYQAAGFNIVTNTRDIISPKEIDIYFPDFKLGIEVNGIYFHSEKFNKTKQYHVDKTQQCNEQGITLLQFWDYEVNNKWDQVINVINSKLGLQTSVHGRKTVVRVVSASEKKEFIESNHLQGDVSSSINLGLYDNQDQLVMITTFGKSRFTKNKDAVQFELLRMCSSAGIQVIGGASKLLKWFISHYLNSSELISYCDRRYSNGNVYNKVGFTFTHFSPPGFFYVNFKGNYAGTRYQWQKHLLAKKLPNYQESLSADANMLMNNYYKVWDCGQMVFTLKGTSSQ